MIALLEQAVALGALRPLDVQFARVVASEDEPDILLAAVLTPQRLELRKRDEPKLGGLICSKWCRA